MSQIDEYLKRLDEKPLASSIEALKKSQVALAKLTDPNSTTIEFIESELEQLSPEFYAFLFKQAKVQASESISDSLSEAIAKLGFSQVKKLLFFHVAYSNETHEKSTELDRIFASRLWTLNYAFAATASYWTSYLQPERSEEVFYLGMFQNLGVSAYAQLESARHRSLRESQRDVPLGEKEREHLGASHYELSIAIVEKWGLPQIHKSAMLFEETNGQSTVDISSEDDEEVFTMLYYSKFRNENKKYGSGIERRSIGFDPHFKYDKTIIQYAAELIKEKKQKIA